MQPVSDTRFDGLDQRLLDRLRLMPEHVLSADGDSFVTLVCRDASGRRVVLKYVHGGSADAHRRLTNESRLVRHLPTRPPLRLLAWRDDGPGYLVTEYDAGRSLRPEGLDDGPLIDTIADALVEFQSIRVAPKATGIADREHAATYYLKVLSKHILHLWPDYLSAWEAARSLRAVSASLPAILSRRVPCHGDFLPTNLLYHADDRTVTFTDLEGFMSANHPLFDVLAFLTIGNHDITNWTWQPRFLRRYLSRGERTLGLDPRSRPFRSAYRGILTFFLVYRLNEARLGLAGTGYFDSLAKSTYVTRKAARLLAGRRDARGDAAALAVRTRNLRGVLSSKGYGDHLETVLAGALS